MHFYLDGKEGPLIATCKRGNISSGANIKFLDDSEIIIEPKENWGFTSSVFFTYDECRYRWKGIKTFRLTTSDGEFVAKFNRQVMALGKDGQLEVYERGKDMVDVIVMTLMMVLYRQHAEELAY